VLGEFLPSEPVEPTVADVAESGFTGAQCDCASEMFGDGLRRFGHAGDLFDLLVWILACDENANL
jgi:hypothetical protein